MTISAQLSLKTVREWLLFILVVLAQPLHGQLPLDTTFIKVQPGVFFMGSEKGRPNERPVRRVVITDSFELGKYEVTQKFWFDVMGTTPADQLELLRKDLGKPDHQDLRGVGDRFPMYLVTWNEVQAFITRLNTQSDTYVYRLPSEAEWEYAARAGTRTLYSFGDDPAALAEYGWYIVNGGYTTHPVGEKKPNPWGFYDMHGNVYEWVDNGALQSSTDYIMKGGSWGNPAESCHSARRTINSPNSRSRALGFRLVRVAK